MAIGLDLTRTARSLLNIEVNTIVRDNMTADQMPPAPHALLDLAGWYADALCSVGVDLAAYFATPLGLRFRPRLSPGCAGPPNGHWDPTTLPRRASPGPCASC
jgi:hypothetical protein